MATADADMQLAISKVGVAEVDADAVKVVPCDAVHRGCPSEAQRNLVTLNLDRALVRLEFKADTWHGPDCTAMVAWLTQADVDHSCAHAVHNGKCPFDQAFGAVKVELNVDRCTDLQDEVSWGHAGLAESACCVRRDVSTFKRLVTITHRYDLITCSVRLALSQK
jgi:hypothetical protein